jgi:hypothetical protein
MSRAAAVTFVAVISAATSGWSQATPETAEFLTKSVAAQAANGVALTRHSWTQSMEIVLDGESKGAIYHVVRFGSDGRMQRTTLGVEEEGRLKMKPFDREAKMAVTAIRGLGGAIKSSKIGGIQETIAAATGLVAAYGRPGSTFYDSASYAVGSGDLDQTMKAVGIGVLKPGDALSQWLDSSTGLLRRAEFDSYLEETDEVVRGVITYGTFEGLTYAAQTTIDIPHEQMQVIVETFDYFAQRHASPSDSGAAPTQSYPDPEQLARVASDAQGLNRIALGQYKWMQRVEAMEDGETETVRLYDFDPGEAEGSTLIGGEWDEGSRNRGIRGRRSRKKAEDKIEDLEEIARLVQSYMMVAHDRVLNFFLAGSFQQGVGELAHTLRVSGSGYLSPEDFVTVWVNPSTGSPTQMSFRTALQDDDKVIEGVVEYVSLHDGPFVPVQTTVTGPGDSDTLIIESFHIDQ